MKNLFTLLLSLCISTALAQDVIVKHDGSTILSKVIKIGTNEVEYKKFSNQNGPTYSILKSDILSINYENGDKDTFEATPSVTTTKESYMGDNKTIEAQPDARNAELISLYNRSHSLSPDVKRSSKKTKKGCFFMAVDENSVLSNSDIEIRFEQKPYRKHINGTIFVHYYLVDKYVVQIHNKTDKTIFVDLGNSFRVMSDGTSKVYYDISQTSISSGSTSGGSVGLGGVLGGGVLGGVSLGGSSTTSTSTTYAKHRIMSVPPHGKIPLEDFKQVQLKSQESVILSEGENSLFAFPKNNAPVISCGEKITYDIDSTPFRVQYTINYALDEKFSTVHTAKCTLYMKDFYGLKDIGWNRGKGSEQKIINEVKETVPDYDDFTVIGSWYESWR